MAATSKLRTRGQYQLAEDGSTSVVDVYEVTATSESEAIATVVAATSLTQGDAHAEITGAKLRELSATPDETLHNVWSVEARYNSRQETRENTAYASQRTKGGMRSSSVEVPAFFDTRGYPLVNTAGDVYEGLGRKVRTRTVNVTHNATSIPNYIFNLSDTLNAAAVTILGTTYPAKTCKLTDVNCPDEPVSDKNGDLYYPVTYNIEINPIGWHILLPNKGPNQLIYQTRTGASADWSDDTKANYDSKSPTSDRRIIKRPIESEEQQNLGGEIWLDENGQAVTVTTLTATSIGTANMTAGSGAITMVTGTLPEKVGSLIRVEGAGLKGRFLESNLLSIASGGGSGYLSRDALETVSGADVYVSGVIVNQFLLEDVADWSSLPLPNNQP
jgi:hypothetical protein